MGRYGGKGGSYADSYSVDLPGSVLPAGYIEAFYTSPVFKQERMILSVRFKKPSTDTQAFEFYVGQIGLISDNFEQTDD